MHSRTIHPQPWCGQHHTKNDVTSRNFYNYSNQEDKEKTPMCRIAELTRFHKLKHEYKLMDESGPAHKKMFTVQLFLTAEEIFEGSGASIKKAQQAAAAAALAGTTLAMPPEKRKKKDTSSPPVLLSHVARRLGLPEPIYRSHSHAKMPQCTAAIEPRFMPFTSLPAACNGVQNCFDRTGYITRDDYSPPHYFPPKIARGPLLGPFPPVNPFFVVSPASRSGTAFSAQPPGERICMVTVAIGPGRLFSGIGNTYAQAKANAAAQCLGFLGPHIQALDAKLKMDEQKRKCAQQKPSTTLKPEQLLINVVDKAVDVSGAPNECDLIPKHKQKSVISQVHECALQMKLNVEFEVIKEVGPPHDRSYVVRCSLKNPKNEVVTACANVLSRLRGIENSPLFIASSLYKLQKRVLNPSREPKRKTIIKDMKMDPTYGHQINPISRLIQVLQARCEDEPQFELVSEQGQSRYKEFTVQVSCGTRICCGSGPNKRLAKRAAAEAMLAEIGYIKPLPPPGKSLLKKKMESPVNIGLFDANNLVPSSLSNDMDLDSVSHTDQQLSQNNEEYCLQEGILALNIDNHNAQQESPDSSPFPLNDGETTESSANLPPSPGRRRVTFSNQVKACPPPEDSNYPEPELAPLKPDVLIEGRVRRIRRTKEAKRTLSDDQKCEIREIARQSMQALQSSNILSCSEGTTDSAESCQILSAKRRLEIMSETFKFSVQYTNFPKSLDGSDPLYFALASLGLERPIVCHGRGSTMDRAVENAALNAISNLCTYDQPSVPQERIGTPAASI
ncbi:hypothetical protein KIN20_017129 [Parelaphostrongylus tenuis]|uniref:DRBM domain-containing protein n=1 Tax=Parelaphostrongylus tenuis TaxID=148309 RepID=A0AAD5MHH8_PARTN|nr:hypothetical protein KIN20_017129 [Parelaphostrongylus tenuis]